LESPHPLNPLCGRLAEVPGGGEDLVEEVGAVGGELGCGHVFVELGEDLVLHPLHLPRLPDARAVWR